MRKISFALLAAALLLSGCTKGNDVVADNNAVQNDDQTVEISIKAIASEITKATADKDGKAANVNHWIMEVRDAQNNVFTRQERKGVAAGTLEQDFTVKLIKSQTYDLLFWADTEGKYSTDNLEDVKVAGNVANQDSRDAFSCCLHHKSTGAEKLSATLTRPFGQINVITTDLEEIWETTEGAKDPAEYMRFKPETLVLTAEIPSSFNVKTQECGTAGTVSLTASACYADYSKHANPTTMFMDYIFCSDDVIDVDYSFVSNGEKVEFSWTNVPMKRNWRTNIKGQLFTNKTDIEVTIDPNWIGEIDYE